MAAMITRARRVHVAPSHSVTGAGDPPAAGRDPAQALYEHAAGLLASAGALRAAAHEPGTAAALGPTLACVEASLDALADVAEQLRNHASNGVPKLGRCDTRRVSPARRSRSDSASSSMPLRARAPRARTRVYLLTRLGSDGHPHATRGSHRHPRFTPEAATRVADPHRRRLTGSASDRCTTTRREFAAGDHHTADAGAVGVEVETIGTGLALP
jgi:hypothetical protein